MVGQQSCVVTRYHPYPGQSQRDGKFEYSLNFKIFLT